MVHYVVLLNARFGYSPTATVRADTEEVRGDIVFFRRGQRIVYQVPIAYVLRIEAYETAAHAQSRVKAIWQRRVGVTLHVHIMNLFARASAAEAGTRHRGFLAERLAVDWSESGRG